MIQFSQNTGGVCRIAVLGALSSEDGVFGYSDHKEFSMALEAAGGVPVNIFISSPGGSLDAALAMRAALEAYDGRVEIHTAGIVASAATLLLCAKNAHVIAHSGSIFMVHQAAAQTYGNADDARKAAQMLDVCDEEIVRVYKTRINRDEKEIARMIRNETWMTSDEAKEIGLVDEIKNDVAFKMPVLARAATDIRQGANGGTVSDMATKDSVMNAVKSAVSAEIETAIGNAITRQLGASLKAISESYKEIAEQLGGAVGAFSSYRDRLNAIYQHFCRESEDAKRGFGFELHDENFVKASDDAKITNIVNSYIGRK